MKKIAVLSLLFLSYLSAMEKSAATKSLTWEELRNLTPEHREAFITHEGMLVKQQLGDEQFNQLTNAWTVNDLLLLPAILLISHRNNNAPTEYPGAVKAIVSPHQITTILPNGKHISLATPALIACMHISKK